MNGNDSLSDVQARSAQTPWKTFARALQGTNAGDTLMIVLPGFVDPANGDFRLGRIVTGQGVDSACIDKGSDSADAVGLGSLTAFTDKFPDAGRVDLGYHGTLRYPSEGIVTVSQATLTLSQDGAGLTFSANLKPGEGGDGLNPVDDFVQVTFGDLNVFHWTGGPAQNGSQWTLQKLADGSVNIAVQVTGLSPATLKFPTSVTVRIGDDYAPASVLLVGVLQVP